MFQRDDLISVEALNALAEKPFLLDVRTQAERDSFHMGGVWIPLDELVQRTQELPRDQLIVVYCHSGQRSQAAVDYLRENGFSNSKNLIGGIVAFAKTP